MVNSIHKLLLILFFLISIVSSSSSQINIREGNDPHFIFTWENDVLFYTDYYYSQGLGFRISVPALKKNPVNYILPSFKDYESTYSLSLIQQMYTPLEIRDSVVRIDDRPYAGLIYLRSEKLSINYDRKFLLRTSLDLGIRGPYSFASNAQYYYHKIGDIVLPQGWQYQMSTLPIVNYNIAIIKQLYKPSEHIDFNGLAEVRMGTINVDLSMGASIKAGLYKGSFSKKYDRKFQLSAKFSAFAKFVAYNGTMQGELKNNPNVYEIKSPDIERIVGSYTATAEARYKNFSLDFSWIYLTPEFEMGLEHRYNSLSLCFYW